MNNNKESDGITKEVRLLHTEWVDRNTTWSDVLPGDLYYIKDIVNDIIGFDRSLPKIKPDIVRAGRHYNVIFKNWNKPIQFKMFYDTFLNKDKRDHKYDVVGEDASINPHPDGETQGPVVQVYILSRSSHSEKRKY